MDSKLEHEIINGSEDRSVVEIANLDHAVKTIGAVRSPFTIDFNDKITLGRFKLRLKLRRRCELGLARVLQARVSVRWEREGHVAPLLGGSGGG